MWEPPKHFPHVKHCCQFLAECIQDPRIGINYDAVCRFYFIDMLDGPAAQNILYCPFCQKKLPKNLWEEYHEILEKEYDDEEDLPKEFTSDTWWKKRKL